MTTKWMALRRGTEHQVDYTNDLDIPITTEEAAHYIGIEHHRLTGWRIDGRGPHFYYRFNPNGSKATLFYFIREIQAWLIDRCWRGGNVWKINEFVGRLMTIEEIMTVLKTDPATFPVATPATFRKTCRLHDGLTFPVFRVGGKYTINNNPEAIQALIAAIKLALNKREGNGNGI